jgi:transmembrane protein TMEM260 (protein O-mannosyltransferase)
MKKIFVALSFVIPLIIYVLTLATDVHFTDSGELASVATSLGIAHPTGYPLFTLLGYLWANLLPWAPIYNLNLMAAFATAASSMFMYFSLRLLFSEFRLISKVASFTSDMKNNLLALFITLGFSFALTTWQQATSVEVYSLQLLLINTFIFIILKSYYSTEKSDIYLILSGFVLGLGFANHLTSFMLIPAGLIVFFAKTKNIKPNSRYKLLAYVIGATLLGVLLYLYLPIRSSQSPMFNWGEVHRSFDKFIYHVTGAQYQVWMFSDSAASKENFKLFFELIPSQLTWIGVLFLFYGFYVLYRGNKTIFWTLLSTAVLCVMYSMNYSIHDIDSYFVTAYVVLFLIVGLAAKQLINYQVNLVYLFAFIPLFNLYSHYETNDLSQDKTVSEYYRLVTESAEKDAIIITAQWDFWVSAFWYKDKIEGKRQDITLIEKELLRRTWYVNSLEQWYPDIQKQCSNEIDLYMEQLEKFEADLPYDARLIQSRFVNMINCFIDLNYGKRPIYLTFDILQSDPDIAKNYVKIPEGFLVRLSKTEDDIRLDYTKFDLELLNKSTKDKSDKLHEMSRNLALLNLKAALNYYQYKGDNLNKNRLLEKIEKFR